MSRMSGWRIGVGPVFVYEWITSSRRWQIYALRSLFVTALLLALVSIWMNTNRTFYASAIRYLAALGEGFFLAVSRHAAHAGAAGGPGGDGGRDLSGPGAGNAHAHADDGPLSRRDRAGQAGRAAGPGAHDAGLHTSGAPDPHASGGRRSGCALLAALPSVSGSPCWVVRWRWRSRSGWERLMKRSCALMRSG